VTDPTDEKSAGLDTSHCHEALDRVFVLSSMFDEFVVEHPAVSRTPELLRQAKQVSDALGELYQALGGEQGAMGS